MISDTHENPCHASVHTHARTYTQWHTHACTYTQWHTHMHMHTLNHVNKSAYSHMSTLHTCRKYWILSSCRQHRYRNGGNHNDQTDGCWTQNFDLHHSWSTTGHWEKRKEKRKAIKIHTSKFLTQTDTKLSVYHHHLVDLNKKKRRKKAI